MSNDGTFMPQHYPLWAITASAVFHLAPKCKSRAEFVEALKIGEDVIGPEPVLGWMEGEHDPVALLGQSGFTDNISVLAPSPQEALETAGARWETWGGGDGASFQQEEPAGK